MTDDFEFKIQDNGDSAVCIIFDAAINEELAHEIIQISALIRQFFDQEILEIIPAYQSITIIYDSLLISKSKLDQKLNKVINKPFVETATSSKLIQIPVCYDDEYAPDMDYLASYTGLSKSEIIKRHTAPIYLVHMLGFLPGFLYLGGLDNSLHCPRKSTPSLKIPKSSVGIGGSQTGIYPTSSPGGWQLIGRTPIKLFRPESDAPFIASPLDKIQFISISKAEFQQMEKINVN
jgi:inhibitor of KinA